MKKVIIAIVLLVMLVGGYFLLVTQVRGGLSLLRGKTDETRRGDLEVPITASGKIGPASITQIKGKASGEVIEIPFDRGDFVHKGDLILRLDKIDEQRNVDRATAEWNRAVITNEKAVIAVTQAKDVGIVLAQAKVAQAVAQEKLAHVDLQHLEGSDAANEGHTTSIELERAQAQYEQTVAMTAAARAEATQANVAVKMAGKDVKMTEQAVKAALQIKMETEERLRETSVYAPIDGVIVMRRVQVGEVVQSGKTSLTGGTVLMEIADLSDVYAEVNVDEADIGLVRDLTPATRMTSEPVEASAASQPEKPLTTLPAGTFDQNQTVEITVETYPDEIFEGVIERISPQSEIVRAIATFNVRIRVIGDNRQKLTKVLGTQAQATFTAKSVTDAVLVKVEAMKPNPSGEGYGVYIPGEPGTKDYEFVPCKFGSDNRVEVAVIEGPESGQKVYLQLPIKTHREKKEEEKEEEVEANG